MTPTPLVIEHDLDAPVAIAWEAITDPELVSGWLGEARITAVVGGEYRLDWVGSVTGPPASGTIVRFAAPTGVSVETDELGDVSFDLEARDGGLRGTWTALRLTVVGRADAVGRQLSEEDWRRALAQLDELLRGHPVDWHSARRTAENRPARGLDRA